MGIVIDRKLAASVTEISLPSGPVVLRQTLHSDLEDGESATITYSLDKRHSIAFKTPGDPAKEIEVTVQVPGTANQRTDTVELVLEGLTTSLDEVMIKQLIEAENDVQNSVILNIIES
jgi:hypothetical protein